MANTTKYIVELGAKLSPTINSAMGSVTREIDKIAQTAKTATGGLDAMSTAANKNVGRLRGFVNATKTRLQQLKDVVAPQLLNRSGVAPRDSAMSTSGLEVFSAGAAAAQMRGTTAARRKRIIGALSADEKQVFANQMKGRLVLSQFAQRLKNSLFSMQNLFRYAATAAVIWKPLDAYKEQAAAVAELARAGTFQRGVDALKQEITELTKTIPLAFRDLAKITASGVRLGIEESQLKRFTEIMGKQAYTLGVNAEEYADSMGRVIRSFGLKDPGAIEQALNAVTFFSRKSNLPGEALISALTGTADIARRLGLGINESVALAATLGKPGTDGATLEQGLLPFFEKLQKLASIDPSASSQQLSSKQADMRSVFLNVLGGDLTKLNTLMRSNKPMEGLLYFLNLVGQLPANDRAIPLKLIFGDFQRWVSQMADASDEMKRNFAFLANPAEIQRFADQAAQQAAESVEGQQKLIANNLSSILSDFGKTLTPLFISLLGVLKPISEFMAEHSKTLVAILGGLLALKGVGALAGAIGGLVPLLAPGGIIVKALSAVALLAPAALGYWGEIKGFAGKVWDKVTSFFGGGSSGQTGAQKKEGLWHATSRKELTAEDTERRSAAYSDVREHSSTGSTNWESFRDGAYAEALRNAEMAETLTGAMSKTAAPSAAFADSLTPLERALNSINSLLAQYIPILAERSQAMNTVAYTNVVAGLQDPLPGLMADVEGMGIGVSQLREW
jgi:TP901 family phage tail tape measure protein